MKRTAPFIAATLILLLAQLACNFPTRAASQTDAVEATLTSLALTATAATATPSPTPTQTITPTQSSSGNNNTGGQCDHEATFVSDVTIPDDTQMSAGEAFTKIWRVRNDGECAWGSGQAVDALIFSGGSRLNAPEVLPISGTVQPGQTLDISVNMVAPTQPGTYTSEWKFRQGSGTLGLGPSHSASLYVRIIVGATATADTRIQLPSGATATSVEGQVSPSAVRGYRVRANQNQLLMAGLSTAANDLTLRIVDSRNNNVLATNRGPAVQTVLPADADYIVQVVGGAQAASYTLGITLPSRITFSSGATSSTVDGSIVNNFPTTYVLRALANQTMTVNVTSPDTVALTIYGLTDGQPLVRADLGQTSYSTNLSLTQDYIIMVVPRVSSTTFRLTVSVV